MIDSFLIAGQIYEALKVTDKALTAYRTCYQLDTTQKDVLMKILQLLLQLPLEPGNNALSSVPDL
jgi:hypothetical protein